jgi:hypothetical protein
MMDDLIEALQIFKKYKNEKYPTNCSHDVLAIMGVEPDEVSDEDKLRLGKLGFFVDKEEDVFISFRFGSA